MGKLQKGSVEVASKPVREGSQKTSNIYRMDLLVRQETSTGDSRKDFA